jgi:hypothetical protein
MERGTRLPESLNRPEGNDLKSNYESHDAAEEAFLSMLPSSVEVYPIGIDERDDDGKLIYDDNPDLLVTTGDGALVDIKSKTSDQWMRFLNERHYWKYRDKAAEHDVPAYVFFYNTNTSESILCRVDGDGRVYKTSTHDFMLSFPDRNKAAYLSSATDVSWGEFTEQIIPK